MSDNPFRDMDDDTQEALLLLLEHDGFLKKQVLPNGKVYYKRTKKRLPSKICIECGVDNYMHTGKCSQALIT